MRLVAVCSGKGGTGKSTVAAYTGAALAAGGKKTLLVDAAYAPGALDLILGAQDSAVFNIWDVFAGECPPEKAIIESPGRPNLFLLPTGIAPENGGGKQTGRLGFMELIRLLKGDYDYIIADDPDFSMLDPKAVSVIMLVVTPDSLSVRAAAQKSRELYDAGAKNLRLVINNVPPRVLPIRGVKDFDDIIDIVGAQLIGVIPASQRLSHSANNGAPLNPESITTEIFDNIAARLRGRHEPLLIK